MNADNDLIPRPGHVAVYSYCFEFRLVCLVIKAVPTSFCINYNEHLLNCNYYYYDCYY